MNHLDSVEIPITIGSISPTYVLTVTSALGGVTDPATGTHTYNANAQVTITATPNTEHYLGNWIKNGVNVGKVNPLVFNITSNTTVSPVFTTTPPPPDNKLLIIAVAAVAIGGIVVAFNQLGKKAGK